jgi:hypothetical protein
MASESETRTPPPPPPVPPPASGIPVVDEAKTSEPFFSEEEVVDFDQVSENLPEINYDDAPDYEEELLYTWVAPSRIYRPRFSRRYTRNLILLFVLIVLLLIFVNQFAFLIVVLSFCFFLFVINNVPPLKIRHTISTYGIYTHNKFYSWADRGNNFWWEESDGQRYVVVETRLFPYKLVMLEGSEQNQAAIDEALSVFLVQRKPTETRVDKFFNWLRSTFPLD